MNITQSENQLKASIDNSLEDIDIISDLSRSILSNLSVHDVIQTAVDRVVEKFNFLGGTVLLVENKKLHLKTISTNKKSRRFVKLVGGKITELNIDLKDSIDNYVVQSVLKNEIRVSDNLFDFTKGVLNKGITKASEIVTGAKSNISIPLIYGREPVGALFFARGYKSDFRDVLSYLQLVGNLVAIAVINAKNYEDLVEALRSEKDMMDVLAHELKTPLTVVKSSVEVLDLKLKQAGQQDSDLAKFTELIRTSVNKEISLLESILSSAKLDQANFRLDKNEIDVGCFLKSIYESFKIEAEKKGLQLIINDSPIVNIKTDKIRLQQILDNFISNAIKYTKKGSVEIGYQEDGEYIKFYVQDTGEGIPKESLQKLGKKFYRVERKDVLGRKQRPPGTGIGLYVAFELIKRMGGSFEIKSELKKGSTFSFKLPKS